MKWLGLVAVLLCGCRGKYDLTGDDAASPFPMVSWTQIAGTPTAAGKSAMPIVPVGDALVGFGGVPHADASTWAFSLAQGGWSSLSVATPPLGRDGHCAAPLPSGDVLFTGGATDTGPASSTVLQTASATYTNVGSDRPASGDGCIAGYLVRSGAVVVYGGTATPDDTYAFDGTAWTKLAPATTPGGRSGAAVVVDPGATTDAGTTDFLVMYGGLAGGVEADDVWIFNGDVWGELSTIADMNDEDDFQPRPDGRTDAVVALDPVRRLLYVFGGERQGVYLNDLWVLDMTSTKWLQLTSSGGSGGGDGGIGARPTGRARASVAYDTVGDRMVLFGGQNESGLLGDGWALTVAH